MLVVYSWNLIGIVQRTFGRLLTRSTAVLLTMPLVTTAFVFKVGYEQDHPGGIDLPFVVDRALLFRTDLALIATATLTVCILVDRENSPTATHPTARPSTPPERLHHLLTLFLITQSRAENIPLFLVLGQQRAALQTMLQPGAPAHAEPIPQRRTRIHDASAIDVAISVLLFSHTSFFSSGGSTSISSIDLSYAYNGISSYNPATVGALLFASNWTGAIWWCSAACDLVPRGRLQQRLSAAPDGNQRGGGRPHANDKSDEPTAEQTSMPWLTYPSTLSALMAGSMVIVMILCVGRREHATVWTIWGSKWLYSVFWVLEWHLVVSLGLSSGLRGLGQKLG
jgi:ethanolaminephosphotransferase